MGTYTNTAEFTSFLSYCIARSYFSYNFLHYCPRRDSRRTQTQVSREKRNSKIYITMHHLICIISLLFLFNFCLKLGDCLTKEVFGRYYRYRGRNAFYSASAIVDDDSIVFAGVRFRHPIATSLRNLNLTYPSPIQKSSLLPLVTGLSCILHAETGSGKTFCYLLPILKRLYDSELHSSGIRVMIIVPTKELAVQVRLIKMYELICEPIISQHSGGIGYLQFSRWKQLISARLSV